MTAMSNNHNALFSGSIQLYHRVQSQFVHVLIPFNQSDVNTFLTIIRRLGIKGLYLPPEVADRTL